MGSLSFSGTIKTNYINIAKDYGSGIYEPPHYLQINNVCKNEYGIALKQSPVSHVSGTYPIAEAKFRSECPHPTIRIRGVDPLDKTRILFRAIECQIVNSSVTYPASVGEIAFETNKVKYLPHYRILWQYSLNNGLYIDVGTSDNPFYITLEPPFYHPTDQRFNGEIRLTSFHVACNRPHNLSDKNQIFDKIFEEFSDNEVNRKTDDYVLSYWDPNAQSGGNCSGCGCLLQNGNSVCNDWAEFLIECGRVHNIKVDQYDVYPPEISQQEMMDIEDYIKSNFGVDVAFSWGEGKLGVKIWNISSDFIYIGQTDDFDDLLESDAGGLTGISAQGTESHGYEPRSTFEGHSINMYNGNFFDPSYGKGWLADEKEFENGAIDIVSGIIFKDVLDANGNPISPAKWYKYIYKRNSSNKDLQYVKKY